MIIIESDRNYRDGGQDVPKFHVTKEILDWVSGVKMVTGALSLIFLGSISKTVSAT